MKNISSILALLIFINVNISGQDVPADYGIEAGNKQVKINQGKFHEPSPASEILLNGETIDNAIVLQGPLPVNASGSTAGYANNYNENCPYTGSAAPDIVYSFTPSGNIIVDIDLCGSSYDTKVFVYQNTYTPGSPFACNDDYYEDEVCGSFTSLISGANLTGGNTYYIVIDGFDVDSYGEFILEIRQTQTCEWGVQLGCPTGAMPESELCGYDDNGGCNMPVGNRIWENVPASGGAFCGTTWADGGLRDTDWYELVLTQASAVSLAANAEVGIRFGLASGGNGGYGGNPDCDDITGMLPFLSAGPCLESSLNLGVLNPGTYWFVVRMNVYYDFPCDNNYWVDFQVTPVTCIPPTNLVADNISATSANLAWSSAADQTAWQYVYGLSPLPVPSGSGTQTTSSTDNPISGLSPDIYYDYFVRADCGEGSFSLWAGPGTFATAQIPATLPFNENFETGTGNWNLVNGSQVNKWVVGSAVSHGGASASYISNNAGQTNTYAPNYSSIVHLYRDISFTGSPNGYTLNFWWRAQGEGTSDLMKVFLLSTSTTLIAGIEPGEGQIGSSFNQNGTWTEVTIDLPASLTGYTQRLVFTWINDNSFGVQPPVAIDDIMIQSIIFTWTGNISNDWNNAGNWSTTMVPNQFAEVEIPSSPSGGRFPVISTGMTASCFKIHLGTGASVTVQGNGILNVVNP